MSKVAKDRPDDPVQYVADYLHGLRGQDHHNGHSSHHVATGSGDEGGPRDSSPEPETDTYEDEDGHFSEAETDVVNGQATTRPASRHQPPHPAQSSHREESEQDVRKVCAFLALSTFTPSLHSQRTLLNYNPLSLLKHQFSFDH